MHKRANFSDDLAQVKDGMDDVGDIVKLIRERRPTNTIEPPKEHRHSTAVANQHRQLPPSPTRSKPNRLDDTRPGLQNVTTRLTPETNDLLTKAALKQELNDLKPNTRQDIIEVAVREWLKRNGYARATTTEDPSE
jgi:hypothetical protein